MIDKKKLIEELLDCVADATDTETQITSLTMAGMLMNEVLDEALTIPNVVERSEQFYCTCSRAKGLDHDEEGTPYCISCQKEVQ